MPNNLTQKINIMKSLRSKMNQVAIKTNLFPELNWFQKLYNKLYVKFYNLFHSHKESK